MRSILVFGLLGAAIRPLLGDPIISEFMASNTNTIVDVDGDNSDWIEIFNPDAAAVNLDGWFLTDDLTSKSKWKIPAVTIAPGGYLVIFASNKNRKDPTKELHTSFSLSSKTGDVALVKSDGTTVASSYAAYPAQLNDISYGVTQPSESAGPRTGFLRTPSPGKRNPDLIYLPNTVTFSRSPGVFISSFALTLSGATAGQRITYTILAPSSSASSPADLVPATEPTAASTTYSGPITVSSSVIVRAEIFSADGKSSSLPSTAQYVLLAPSAAGFSSALPVVVLDTHGGGQLGKDGVYHPAWIYTFTPAANGPTTITSTPTLATPIGMTVHGNYSSNFAKKSWGVELRDTLGYNNSQPLLGLDNDRQWEFY